MREIQHVSRNGTCTLHLLATVPITFTEEDCHAVVYPHRGAFIISANIAGIEVRCILVDNGSTSDLLFITVFEAMGFLHTQLWQAGTLLSKVSGEKPSKPWAKSNC